MSATAATGSPTFRRAAASRSISQENSGVSDDKLGVRFDSHNTISLKKSSTALSTSKLGNQAAPKMKINHESAPTTEISPMEKLLAKLSEQTAAISKQHQEALKSSEESTAYTRTVEYISSASSAAPVSTLPITPVTETHNNSAATSTRAPSNTGDSGSEGGEEVLRLKLELEAAKVRMARMDEELAQSRITKHTIDQAMGPVSEADFSMSSEMSNPQLSRIQQSINVGPRPQMQRDHSWTAQDDARSDTSDALSAGGLNRSRNIWGNSGKPGYSGFAGAVPAFQQPESLNSGQWLNRGVGQPFIEGPLPYSGPPVNGFGGERLPPDSDFLMAPPIGRRQGGNNRLGRGSFPYASSNSSYDGYTPASTLYGSVGGMAGGVAPIGMGSGMNMGGSMYGGYQPQPIGTPLSPMAPEFTSGTGGWKNEVNTSFYTAMEYTDTVQAGVSEGQTFLPTTEPLNYRRLLDRTVNCNWKYIVDKIVCNNDQQASIFLQQKLKIGTTEQKYDIVEAIVAQAYPLMINRFGNFLVQRCFEHGTPDQVIKIAEAIRGNTLSLSMDAFGCHVVQKAFDSVPEDYKAIMVHELLRRIPETVIHRYACHVWQKLFELRWTESPPQIMKFVNDSLRGMWHEVALGETGSLVVQNIFENCLEEDKRPCIEEVLASIDIVAHGQFGNWCIQHICEHGAPADRSRAIDHVIRYASEYSMDQFASKVVEKCLKIRGVDFLGRYLDRVCEGRLDRPRIPLIDIASDQYGNYLIQYILTHSNPQHREIVAQHIRKHMVSLRGSKFGSRVGMLCTNPAIQTRPGPGVGPAISAPTPRIPQQPPRYGGGAYR
ncbi:putative Meiotic coiled-coil protein 2 [Glarea lozoyensis 74030]|uniref:Putative Meiotic coiled-coil protein 2 n=1 Tax=Glarea lozoyensis (strain ATCC 74030 / MF5533) TaxID=1104152 RepID=H0ERU3_GLAL7|nr:putative Meiotic coiled-coil protein 2 [Glarea lozoyensis 74030]